MTPHRPARTTSLLALGSLVTAMVGWASVGAGGYYPYGTAKAAERQVGTAAVAVGVVLAVALLVVVARQRGDLDPTVAGLAIAVAALPLAVPAMWALGSPLSTPAADSTGCGSVTTPQVPAVPPGAPSDAADSCRTRLGQQRVVVGVLALPALGLLAVGATQALRRPGQDEADGLAALESLTR